MSDETIFEEIGRFDQDYAPAERQSFLPGVEALRDGVHVLEVVRAEVSRTEKTREAIFKLILRAADGLTFERAYFFRDQDSVDRLGADLAALGLDSDKWNGRHNRRFSVELAKCPSKLAGVRFQAKKETKPGNTPGKDYHNLYISVLIGGPKGAAASAAATPAAPKPTTQDDGGTGKDIPF